MGSMDSFVTTTVVVVWGDATETRGNVKGCVLLENSVHSVSKLAIRTVKDNAIKPPGFVSAVSAEGLEVTVVVYALVVPQGVTKTPGNVKGRVLKVCLLYTSPSPRDLSTSRMPSSA